MYLWLLRLKGGKDMLHQDKLRREKSSIKCSRELEEVSYVDTYRSIDFASAL